MNASANDVSKAPATWADALAAEQAQLARNGLQKQRQPVGLALSGGGIRAATFSLGLLQGLAEARLLSKFHYLSTVSGGGYIGSWLSALIKRRAKGKVEDVQEILAPKPGDPREDSAIQFLRRYSNYLTPQVGIMSVDTWTAIVTYTRNLMINLTVLLCVVVSLILAVHLVIALGAVYLQNVGANGSHNPALWAGFGALLVAAVVIGLQIGRGRGPNEPASQKAVLAGVVTPTFFAAACWAFYFGDRAVRGAANVDAANVVAHCLIVNFVLWVVVGIVRWFKQRSDSKAAPPQKSTNDSQQRSSIFDVLRPFFGWLWLPLGGVLGGAAAGAVIYGYVWLMAPVGELGKYIAATTMTRWLAEVSTVTNYPGNLEFAPYYLSSAFHFAVGTLVMLWAFATGVMVLIAVVKRHLSESDREWLARLGGWLYVGSALWSVVFAIIALGPGLVIWISANFPILAKSGALLWVAQTVGALVLGKSAVTGGREPKRPWLEKLLSFAPYIFILGVLFIVAYGVDRVLIRTNNPDFTETLDKYCNSSAAIVVKTHPDGTIKTVSTTTTAADGVATKIAFAEPATGTEKQPARCEKLNRTISLPLVAVSPSGVPGDASNWDSPRWFFVATFFFAMVTLFISWRVDVNLFSFQQFYRDRLARCYLGASRFRAVWQQALDKRADDKLVDEGISPTPERNDRSANQFTDLSDDDDLYLASLRDQQPFHIINTAINMTAPGELGWQERKAASFTMTPLHCGFSFPGAQYLNRTDEGNAAGYRPTEHFSRGDDTVDSNKPYEAGAKLGMAMSTSGAAASSSMGHNSTAALSLLLTVFNVRLGRWVGNPAHHGTPWKERSPWLGLRYLIRELFGDIDNRSKFVYLSDGGHFENLGVYELVRRRASVIVVSSCGRDLDYVFDDLSNAIRLCYTDFGVTIDIDAQAIKPDEHGVSRSQFAVGRIGYKALGEAGIEDGYLIYVKPAITARTSVDILQYRSTNPDFPQQSTANQWYTESQFESYRKLGLETARELMRDALSTHHAARTMFDLRAAQA